MTTREEAIALAREVGLILHFDSKFGRDDYLNVQSSWPAVERLIDLAKAKENEACAKVLQDNADACGEESIMRHILESQILAIRARRNHG